MSAYSRSLPTALCPPAGLGQHRFGQTRAEDLDLRCGLVDLAKVVGRESYVGGPEVFLETSELRRPRDRHDPGPLSEEPGERDLRWRRLLACGDPFQKVDQSAVCRARFGREPGRVGPEVAGHDLRFCVDFTGQEPGAEWTEGNEADPELLAHRERAVLFDVARPEGILALQRRNGLHGVGSSYRRHAGLRQPKVLHLALLDQVLDRPGDVLHRHVRIDAMLIEEVDAAGTKALKRRIYDPSDVVGAAVEAAVARAVRLDAE